MDSMRHLSTSLPSASVRRRRVEPPQQLLGSFKEAALSVTNLYKAAAVAQDKARAAGYQDALDDLLTFLDAQNLGLMDGEGWRVRQWATERLDDDSVQPQSAASDDDDESGMEATRSSTPEVTRKPAPTQPLAPASENDGPEHDTQPSKKPDSENTQPQCLASSSPPPMPSAPLAPANYDFTFRSQNSYPTNHDREGGNNNMMDLEDSTSSSPNSTDSVRVHSRPTRHRHSTRPRNTGSTLNLNLGSGAGSKRKTPFPDFFDISGFSFDGSDRRDGGGRGGKRGRHV
ncbi:Hypothetical protein R9X50_00464100 [Acrodontium crateriforme]|uniref:Uncharacterized protein n=1 Tax=Acrodontium crateriforme TaxID=150365 RepID=A0AAQ3M5U6_9PEZI|nr:Hypothetical protein R9X50_00464100 [Acrodontium crateriforme]